MGSVDWGTLLASAGVSAVVGAVVSLLAVHQVTVRRAKAERADASGRPVRAAVAPLLAELTRYQYQPERPAPKRNDEASHMDDHTAAARVLVAASDLPGWRRRLVERRCRRVFGRYWTGLALDYPVSAADGEHTFAAWLAGSFRQSRSDQPAKPGHGPLDGLTQRAYSELPGHPLLRRLRRELRRLAVCR